MAGRTSSPNTSAKDGTFKVKVKKPALGSVNSARQIRDAILRDYFGYTESDIKELDAQKPGGFFIYEKSNPKKEMTDEQVKG